MSITCFLLETIFIDELEAYYGNRQIFERDLALIRDLIFTVKRFNTIFAKSHAGKTKIICSVRSEIINAKMMKFVFWSKAIKAVAEVIRLKRFQNAYSVSLQSF